MPIRNLTPHDIVVGGTTYTPAGKPPRLAEVVSPFGTIEGHRVVHVSYGPTADLPPIEPGVFLIVSQMVCDANPDRTDLMAPSELIRDDKGRIIGCASFRASPGMLHAMEIDQ